MLTFLINPGPEHIPPVVAENLVSALLVLHLYRLISLPVFITARVVRMHRFCLVCVCLSRCQKLIISLLHHILHTPRGVWTHLGMSICPFVRSGQKVHLKETKLLELNMLGMRSSHVGNHPVFPVHLTGRTDTFWDGLGCLSGLFVHLADFVQLLITFKHCVGMLTKRHTPCLP